MRCLVGGVSTAWTTTWALAARELLSRSRWRTGPRDACERRYDVPRLQARHSGDGAYGRRRGDRECLFDLCATTARIDRLHCLQGRGYRCAFRSIVIADSVPS